MTPDCTLGLTAVQYQKPRFLCATAQHAGPTAVHNADATKFVLAAMGQYKKQSQLLNYDPYRYDLKGVEEKENANVCTSHAVNEISIMLYHTLL